VKILRTMKRLNGARGVSYPYVHSKEGSGCYFKDLDGNTFLDFASQVCSNPLGYNHPGIKETIKQYMNRSPVKFAGQDFLVKEHGDLLEELLSITPKQLNAAFLINSGAEAVENAMKICMHKRTSSTFGISCTNDFHGRTLGALSYTHSNPVHKKGFFTVPNKQLPFSDQAPVVLEQLTRQGAKKIAFVIMEMVQGEGGYNVASKKMIRDVRKICSSNSIPFICDEVQSGMGRTGKWWAFQHFGIVPDAMSSAKALNVGATIANKKLFPVEEGAISSTWGGGNIIDLAVGCQTIKIIKKKRLLSNVQQQGMYVKKRLNEVSAHGVVRNVRGLGLMVAFDLPTKKIRDDMILESLQRGLVLLGCGPKGVRIVPPFIVSRREIDEAINIIEASIKRCCAKDFSHTGAICQFTSCTTSTT
jgi:4-aminobutyrate aminotransferase